MCAVYGTPSQANSEHIWDCFQRGHIIDHIQSGLSLYSVKFNPLFMISISAILPPPIPTHNHMFETNKRTSRIPATGGLMIWPLGRQLGSRRLISAARHGNTDLVFYFVHRLEEPHRLPSVPWFLQSHPPPPGHAWVKHESVIFWRILI